MRLKMGGLIVGLTTLLSPFKLSDVSEEFEKLDGSCRVAEDMRANFGEPNGIMPS
jgi:hypothetical protein